MKKRTSSMSRRVVSLLMSLVLTLTLVTPAAFATEVVGGSGTAIIEGNANPADANPSGDNEGKDDENKDTEHGGDEQPTNPGDEDKNPGEGDGGSDDANKPGEDNKGKQNTEDENNSEDDIAPLNDDTDSDVWDGKPAEKFAGGAGTVDDPYKISTGAELAYLAGKVNGGESYSGEYFKLTNDIRLNEQDVPTGGNSWTPIGNSSNKFQGTFDGDGHTISGLYITATGSGAGNLGLFGNLGNSAVIKNLIVKGTVDCDKKTYVAGVAGRCVAWKTVVQNCGFYGNVVGGNSNVGGVVGFGNNVAKNCWYYYSGDTDGYKVGVSGGTAGNNCYQNVSSSAKGTYVQANFADTVTEKLNASLSDGDKLWKVGTKHPEFPGPNERVVILDKYLPTSTAAMSIKDDVSGKLVSQIIVENGGQVTLVPTGTVWYSLDGKNWDSFSGERSIQINATEQTVRIYYAASDEEMEAGAWYKKDEGTSETPYEIGSAAQLAYLAKLVNEGNSFQGKFIRLKNDIRLNDKDVPTAEDNPVAWTPIGVYVDGSTKDKPFSGTFDGNGHTISGLYINSDANGQGLFAVLGAGGTVQNLIVTGTVHAPNSAVVGGIAAKSSGTVRNCGFYGDVQAGKPKSPWWLTAGGVVGDGNANNCWYYQTTDDKKLGTAGSYPTNSYQNVSASLSGNGTYIKSEGFAAAVAEKLNPAAFEKGWKLWAAEDGENAKPYPLFSEQNANELVLVKLQPYVKFGMNSELFGKVTFAGGGTSALAKVDTKLTLQADGGMAAFYTTESEKQDSYTTTDGLKQFSEAYVVNKSDGGKVVTLYYGSANDFTATALERAFYYDALNYTIKSITYKDENDENKTASAEEVFQTFAGLVNKGVDFKGKTVNLGADIDLSDIEWTPVGTADHPFRGIFTGGTSYYTISGLKVNGDFANAGLFGVVDGGTIQYVTITDSTKTEETADESGETTPVEKTIPAGNVNGKGNTGSIVGWLKSGKVESCMSTATVKGSGNTGGLVGLVGAETVGETAFVGTVNGSYYYNEARVGVPAAGKVLEGSAINKSFYLAETSTFGNTANENGENGDTGARTAEEFAAGRVAWELKSSTNSKWGCTDDLRPCLGSSVKPMELKVSARDAMPVGVTLEIQLSDKNSGDMLRQLNDDDGTVYAYVKQYANVTMSWTLSGPTETQVMFEPSDKVRQREGSSGCVYVSDNVSIQYYFIGADISWYNEETIAKKAYTIKTPAELNGLALLVNGKVGKNETFEGWTLTLGNDISLKGYDWTPIGSSYSFEGVFDGSGHSITDLQIDVTLNSENDHGPWGLFGKLGDTTGNASAKATIKNLTVDGSVTVIGKQIGCNVGGIVGYIYKGATVEHCHNLANVTAEAWYRKLGRNDSSTEPRAGGIAGYNEGGTITNCLNEGAVTIRGTDLYSQMYAGGIVGKASNGSVEYCWNYGTVDASGVTLKANAPTYFSRFVSGIAGSGTVLNCANFGMVKTGNGIPASGIGGMVTNSYNMGSVTGPEDKVYSISKERTVNSYTIDLTANTGVYVKNSAGTTDADKSQPITITPDADGKNTTYTIDEKPLVDVLNEACTDMSITGACLWTNKVDAPWNPVHVTQWNGEDVPGAPGKVTVTYYSNMTGSDTGKVDSAVLKDSKSHTFTLKTADELNFRNENGRFMGWALSAEGAVAYPYKDGKFTSAKEVTVNEAERNVNLYAVWEQLWTGTGTEVDPYKINDLNDLKKLQTQVNEGYYQYADKWFALTADIDMKNEPWKPIGTSESHKDAVDPDRRGELSNFAGNLDGNNFTIKNLNVEGAKGEQYVGLFGFATGSNVRTFKNLVLKGRVEIEENTSTGTSWCAGLIACAENGNGPGVILDGITVDINIPRAAYSFTAGIVGRGVTQATKCNVYGFLAGGSGLTDYNRVSGTFIFKTAMEDCHNYATINGRVAVGLWGGETGKVVNCSNSGNLTATGENSYGVHNSGYAAGIAYKGQFDNCMNDGTVASTNGSAFGIAYSGTAEHCRNIGSVSGALNTYGIVGGGSSSFCYNLGQITAKNGKAYGIGGSANYSFTYNEKTPVALNVAGSKNDTGYYLSDKELSSGGIWATKDDFASGKVAWGVDGGEGAHKNYWTQGANNYPVPIGNGTSTSYYRAKAEYGTGGTVTLTRSGNEVATRSSTDAVYGPAGTSVAAKATPKNNTFKLSSLTLDLMSTGKPTTLENGGDFHLGEANAVVKAEFTGNSGGGGGYYYGGTGDGTGTGDKDDEGLQDGLNMDVEYDIKGLVLGAYAEWGSNGGNKSFQKWLEENPNVVRALLTNSLDNMATAAVGKKTDETKDLAALLLASLNEHTGVDGKDGDTIAKALQKYIDSGSEEVFSAWLTGGGGMASGTYESIYGQYASSLAALADRLYSKWEASGTSMTFPVWLDSQQVSMDSLSENADEPDTDNTNDPQTSDAPDDVPDGQDTEGGASGNSVWEIIGTVVRENPILVWSIVAVIAALIIVGAVRRYHKVKRDEHDEK